jgi:Mycothiol maleylpyruvate isomerase N-terminal domain
LKQPEPILVAHLFPELRGHLLKLLEGLSTEEWNLPTGARLWTVKDIALHLLGGDVGILSRKRDGFTPAGRSIESWEGLVAFINHLNDTWLQGVRRVSTRVLCDLLAFTGPQVEEYFASLDPFAEGDRVSWAGPHPAPIWLDIAREYTERWHHQQQIRDAASRPGLYTPRLFAPVLDAFVRALPRTFHDVHAPNHTTVQLCLEGPGGGVWCIQKTSQEWKLLAGSAECPSAEVTLATEDAWKIFTRGLSEQEAMNRARIRGEERLGAKLLQTVSVIA